MFVFTIYCGYKTEFYASKKGLYKNVSPLKLKFYLSKSLSFSFKSIILLPSNDKFISPILSVNS